MSALSLNVLNGAMQLDSIVSPVWNRGDSKCDARSRKKCPMVNSKELAKRRLLEQFKSISDSPVDDKGYVYKPEHNLISDLRIADFRDELQGGSGNELEWKFCAVHSSAALVVNTFGIWKNSAHTLELCGVAGFDKITFERKCPTGLKGTPPNIDLLAESQSTVIGIESKLTEHLALTQPKFSASYSRCNLPYVEDKWWKVLENNRNGAHQYLDVAQLIKHYIGLRNQKEFQGRNIILHYLFWEPENWGDKDTFIVHRREVRTFAEQVKNTSVRFMANSYPELWSKWEAKAELEEHLNNLRRRYLLTV